MSVSDLVRRDLAVLWHPCSQMRDHFAFPPLELAAAEGCRLRLADGRELIDGISSWWCKNLGHRHPRLLAALAQQAARYEQVILANTAQEPAVRLAERLLALANQGAGPGFAKVFYADNGSTGVEVALKLALHWQGLAGQSERRRFACLAGGYHGETAGALSVSDCGLYKRPYQAMLTSPLVLAPVPWRSGHDASDWQDAGPEWQTLEPLLEREAGSLAAVVYEPLLQGAGGMRPVSPDLLRRLRTWADGHGVLLIADEIAAGLWRCGSALAHHQAGCLPDLAVLGKGLTAGVLPLAAVLAPQRLYDACLGSSPADRAFLHSNTFAGNALACAVANAAFDEYQALDAAALVAGKGDRLRRLLAAAIRSRPRLGRLRGLGLVAAVDLLGCDPAQRCGWRVFRAAVARGCLLRPLGDTLYILPPFTIDDTELERLVTGLVEAVDEVLGGG